MPTVRLILLKYAICASILLTFAGEAHCTEVEVGTFSTPDLVIGRLVDRLDNVSRDNWLSRLDVEFRTSHANDSAVMIGLQNDNDEKLSVVISQEAQLTVRLAWLSDVSAGGGDYDSYGPDYNDYKIGLGTLELTLEAAGVGAGEWHRLAITLGNDGALTLDGSQVGQLPRNFSAQFAWNTTTQVLVGGGFRGCIANVSLDGVARVPLHSGSQLLNRTDSVAVNVTASRMPGGGPGCRQECPCLPNGECVYQRWNLLQRCNCSIGYEGQRCESEWNTCMHLEPNRQCLNGGNCENLAGPQAYWCRCTPAGQYVGSRCQSFNHCSDPITCQNGANCSLTGDPEIPSSVEFSCTCASGFTGRNCSIPATQPDNGVNTQLIVGVTVGVIAVLLLLIAALVAVKVIRERRRDFGAYRPSQREVNHRQSANGVYADQAMIGMNNVMRPPKEERFI